MTPHTLILRTAGTNCDAELIRAFELAGASTESIHLNALCRSPGELARFDLLGLPGGFSYGDDIAAGRILANRLRHRLLGQLQAFIAAGKPIIGICNGFQVLVKMGLLPGPDAPGAAVEQTATLADNARPRFVDRWVGLAADPQSVCIWTRGLADLPLPIAHGEGRFVASDEVLNRLEATGQVALRYTDNPNGSMRDIAGVCDRTGVVLGLMPHPERFAHRNHHPDFSNSDGPPLGLELFRNAVAYAKANATVDVPR